MRIPPIYEKPGWQRFFAGMVIGALISWFVFLYQFGELQEEQIQAITKQKSLIQNLEKQKDTLIEDYEKLNEENKKKLIVQDFEIKFLNHKKYDLDPLSLHIFKDSVIKDLNTLIGRDIGSISESTDFIMKAIENRTYELDEKKYRLKVKVIILGTTLKVNLMIELAK